jgi:REase_MTES_1575
VDNPALCEQRASDLTRLVDMTFDNNQPFTRRQALSRGLTVKQIAGPRYQKLFQGLYLPAGVAVTTIHRARAVLMIAPDGSYISHHTAATLWGGCAPTTAETHVTVPADHTRSRRRGVSSHRADPGLTSIRHKGIALSSPASVFLEMAALRLDLVDLVVLGDSLVQAKRTTPEELVKAADGWFGKGARRARQAARLVRTGVDSPTESTLRMVIVLAGLPEPEVNAIIRDDDGEWLVRFDLCYRSLKLIIEYDGRQHLTDAKQWSRDLLRREALERQGWRLIVINADALYGDPAGTLRRIWDALADRGCQNLPARTASAWTRHFGSRVAA